MAQLDKELYVYIANSYNEARAAMADVAGYLYDAIEEVTDVTTDNYPSSSPNSQAAVNVTISLIPPLQASYSAVKSNADSVNPFLTAVSAINDYVIRNSEVSGSASEKLTDFVNNCEWDPSEENGGLVPYYWVQLSETAGYDTSNWDKESSEGEG